MKRALVLGIAVLWEAQAVARLVLQPNPKLPITAFNITFRVGSADDPPGQQGVALLTARLIREGGLKAWAGMPARTRAELEDFLFPYAADIEVTVRKEQTSFRVITSAADAEAIFGILSQMLLAPAMAAAEWDRIRAEMLDALAKQWPREDQEELGKAALDQFLYGQSHPYSHVTQGTVKSVTALTAEAVRRFYQSHYTQSRVQIGIAGVVGKKLPIAARALLDALPKGNAVRVKLPKVALAAGHELLLVKGPFEAVGVHLGHPHAIHRASADFAALYLASTAFGKHRSFVGRLMRAVREIRGLNYGTYSYVEDFPDGGRTLIEPTQAARQQQAWTLWGRPTTLENGCFLLKQMLREASRFVKEGLTPEEFQLGKNHLLGYVPLLATGIDRRLGYTIDSRFYGVTGDYLTKLQKTIEALSHATVTRTVQKHLNPQALKFVAVTPDPKRFREALLSGRCEITYPKGITKEDAVVSEDKEIAAFRVPLRAEQIREVASEALFQ